ncbi:RidA family protein [Clostridium sp. DL1XJH146]
MKKKIISTDKAPGALGAYSQAVKVDNMIITSGQIPIDPATGDLIKDDVQKATEQVMVNLIAVLEEAGAKLSDVVKTTIFLQDIDDFSKVNEVYARFFTENEPARSCVQAGALPKDALLEIEVMAIIE